MNVFGSFSFGRLIKTFIPGFALFLVFCSYLELLGRALPDQSSILATARGAPVLFVAVAIPLSIILGLLSNSLFFSVLTTRLLEEPFHRQNSGFEKLELEIRRTITETFEQNLTTLKDGDVSEFRRLSDPHTLLLSDIGVAEASYVAGSFWYYLEFQLNLMPSIVLGLPAAILLWVTAGDLGLSWAITGSLFILLLGLFLSWLLLFSSRKNYRIHRRKQLNLLVAAYCRMRKT